MWTATFDTGTLTAAWIPGGLERAISPRQGPSAWRWRKLETGRTDHQAVMQKTNRRKMPTWRAYLRAIRIVLATYHYSLPGLWRDRDALKLQVELLVFLSTGS